MGIKSATVKWHLRRALEKGGFGRIKDLAEDLRYKAGGGGAVQIPAVSGGR
jgi:DNA-binding CsgD family transcriptional regulator